MDPQTIIVSIGRNVDGKPMSAVRWARFREVTRWAVETIGLGRVVFEGTGTGIYEGATEESYTVIATEAPSTIPSDVGRYWLARALSHLSELYDQDSIALTYGNTEFREAGLMGVESEEANGQ